MNLTELPAMLNLVVQYATTATNPLTQHQRDPAWGVNVRLTRSDGGRPLTEQHWWVDWAPGRYFSSYQELKDWARTVPPEAKQDSLSLFPVLASVHSLEPADVAPVDLLTGQVSTTLVTIQRTWDQQDTLTAYVDDATMERLEQDVATVAAELQQALRTARARP